MKTILVLCTGNSCRSQMAEGWLKHFAGNNVKVYSAGIQAHGLNPLAVEVMKESGIDISTNTSDVLDKYIDMQFDCIITVCDNVKEKCPFIPGNAIRIHKNFTDPAKATGNPSAIKNVFRNVRDEIKEFCCNFVKEIRL